MQGSDLTALLIVVAVLAFLYGLAALIGYVNRNRVVGLSLSFCIADISRGTVKESDVDKIITSTMCATKAEWLEVLEQYSLSYWRHDPEGCKAIANRLYQAGKIDQPRLRGERPNFVGKIHWMKPRSQRPELNW